MNSQLADPITGQLPLIVVVESDDEHLRGLPGLVWFERLSTFDWLEVRQIGSEYYEGLWRFNKARGAAREGRNTKHKVPYAETKEEATLRLLFERPTLLKDAPVLPEEPEPVLPLIHVEPEKIAPGHVPFRLAGRAPKCFFAMFKAFVGVALRGRAPEPDEVHDELVNNPSFARICGFTLPSPEEGYRQSDVPSLRKLEQFDQIMTENGLWGRAAADQIRANFSAGLVTIGSTLIHDTTHYKANSVRHAVEIPEQNKATRKPKIDNSPEAKPCSLGASKRSEAKKKAEKKAKKSKRKSHPKTTKNCRCEDRATCPHPWVSTDPGAGTVVKHGGKMHWAHKASTLAFAGQEGILLDAVAMTDAATHDSQSVVPHLARIFDRYPELNSRVTRLLDDGAADDKALKDRLAAEFSIELLAPPNPRGRKVIKSDMPRGIDHITTAGYPVCKAEYPLKFVGCRQSAERFLFRAPDDADGKPVCDGCPFMAECCHPDAKRRHVSIAFERLPWIDPAFPQLSVTFNKELARRTLIERLHKLMKFDYGDERLSKRGHLAFQARLDKTLLAMHIALKDSS